MMIRHRKSTSSLLALSFAALLASAGAAGAATSADVDAALSSAGLKNDYDRYTRAINDTGTGWEARVELLRRRGALLSDVYMLEPALDDFREAANLAPHYSLTHLDLATVLTKLGRYPEAYSSYKAGFQANPANLVLFMTRGMTHFNDQKYRRAERDFRRHLAFNAKDMYRMMWLSLAVTRQGGDGKAVLSEFAGELDRAVWPGPLVDLYLGNRSVDDVVALVADSKLNGHNERRCETYFFIAQWYAANGDEDTARDYFRKTVDTDVRGFMEYASARLVLDSPR